MTRRTITITLRVETDADDRALERAFEAMISDETVSDTLLEGESFKSIDFGFDVADGWDAPTTALATTAKPQSAGEETSIEEAVDTAMEAVRDSHLMDDGLPRRVSVAYLVALSERVNELTGELMGEAMKDGDVEAVEAGVR